MTDRIVLVMCGVVIGMIVAFLIRSAYDKYISNKYLDGIYNPRKWCATGCKYMEQCMEECQSVEEAESMLCRFCKDCPIEYACNVIEDSYHTENHA